jgi:hypothetical protein
MSLDKEFNTCSCKFTDVATGISCASSTHSNCEESHMKDFHFVIS